MFTILVALTLTPTAEALSCIEGAGDAFPSDSAVGVSLDVIPRISLYGLAEVTQELVIIDEAAGTLVPFTAEVVENPGNTHLAWLRPDGPLSPDVSYSVAVLSGEDLDDAWRLSTFTTGDAALSGDPQAPTVLDVDRDKGKDMWGSWDWIRIGIDSEPATYQVQVASSADFSDAEEIHLLANSYDGIELSVGSGVCGGSLELASGEQFVRVAAVDYAGNVSEYSSSQSSGCSAVSGASSLTGALFGVLAVLGMRRRKVTT
ncbi:MAG: hypothetical protein ACI8S6_000177 [Myxococcota bacterium]|jgi:uncharacterized protein (TIGR03382 family)